MQPPHLHYGVYADEGAINPYPLLTARQDSGGSGSASDFRRADILLHFALQL